MQFRKQRLHPSGTTEDFMSPWFARVEQRLNIGPWVLAPHSNN